MRVHEHIRESLADLSSVPPQPAVASISLSYTAETRSADDIIGRVRSGLENLAAAVRLGGGFVGHIKSFITFAGGGSAALSVVRDRAELSRSDFDGQGPAGGFKLAVSAIVYGFEAGELRRLLDLALAAGLPETVCRPALPAAKNLKPIIPFISPSA